MSFVAANPTYTILHHDFPDLSDTNHVFASCTSTSRPSATTISDLLGSLVCPDANGTTYEATTGAGHGGVLSRPVQFGHQIRLHIRVGQMHRSIRMRRRLIRAWVSI